MVIIDSLCAKYRASNDVRFKRTSSSFIVYRSVAYSPIKIALIVVCALLCLGCGKNDQQTLKENTDNNQASIQTVQRMEAASREKEFYETVMNAAPYLPSNLVSKTINCQLQAKNNERYLSSRESKSTEDGWESRISHSPEFFDIPASEGRILLIDFAQAEQNDRQNADTSTLKYRYLSNDNSHNDLYEPWSSSKIFAFTGALAKMRQQGLGAQAKVGETFVADMITGINSYEAFGTASGESNALATFFANLAGRDYLSALFYDEWLKLSDSKSYFRGAYGPVAFEPSSYIWQMLDEDKSTSISPFLNAADDPGYLPYRCESCGLTGNKPMTTLAQAEWLKRLATHDRDPSTAHPMLTTQDLSTLFYGSGNSYSDKRVGGMMLGISTMLHYALAEAISGESVKNPKNVLDKVSDGQWRVFQKIGWGPSETRSTTENVVLAHVCLPQFQGGREFTIAAQVAVDEAREENLPLAGQKMQVLLTKSLRKLFSKQE
ncbi:hypothetical protein PN836_016920 [Ningiella sp. W23]|uniref:hypothetical protein n=1 Tax=Ningiella sp. W23 TaxID=3023715 RepID=UPI00375648B0